MNSDQLLKQVFEDGRTHRTFIDKPIQFDCVAALSKPDLWW